MNLASIMIPRLPGGEEIPMDMSEANLEAYHDALREFPKSSIRQSNLVLDEYLCNAAKTGKSIFPWNVVQPFFLWKLESTMREMAENLPYDHLPRQPNVENITADEYRHRILSAALRMNGIPFTFQRLCELLCHPRKHYRRADKYLRAVEKNIWIVGTIDPNGNREELTNGNELAVPMDESQLSSDQEEMIDVRQTETADKNGESTISTYASFTPLLDEEGKENCRPQWNGVGPQLTSADLPPSSSHATVEISSLPSLAPPTVGPMPSIEAMWGQRQSAPVGVITSVPPSTADAIGSWLQSSQPSNGSDQPNFATMTPLQVPSLSTSAQLPSVDTLTLGGSAASTVVNGEEFLAVDSTVEIFVKESPEAKIVGNVSSTSEDGIDHSTNGADQTGEAETDKNEPDTTGLEPPKKQSRWDMGPNE